MSFIMILAIIGVLVGSYLQYLQNKKKLHGFGRYLLLVLLILSAILVTRQDHEKRNLNDQLLYIGEHNAIMESKYDSLQDETHELTESYQELLKSLLPFERIAQTRYPRLLEAALTMLAADLSKGEKEIEELEPKLVYYYKHVDKDTASNTFITSYYFRSQPPMMLRNVSVQIKFDRPIIKAEGLLKGVIVAEQGKSTTVDADSLGITFWTDLLRLDNDVIVKAISREPLNIVWSYLHPDGQR